ncbi:MAG: coproporphyrinogen III oxidase, partial [Bacteroidota bacterium]
HNYYENIETGRLAVQRGFFLNEEDKAFRQYIKDIACKGSTFFQPQHIPVLENFCFPALSEPLNDGLVEYNKEKLSLTPKGHFFIRNICSAFDLYLQRNNSTSAQKMFSKAI